MRAEIVRSLLSREPWTLAYLRLVKSDSAAAALCSSRWSARGSWSTRTRRSATWPRTVLGRQAASPRSAVIAEYKSCLSLRGEVGGRAKDLRARVLDLPSDREHGPRHRAEPGRVVQCPRARGPVDARARSELLRSAAIRAVRRRRPQGAHLHGHSRGPDVDEHFTQTRKRRRRHAPAIEHRRTVEHGQVPDAGRTSRKSSLSRTWPT